MDLEAIQDALGEATLKRHAKIENKVTKHDENDRDHEPLRKGKKKTKADRFVKDCDDINGMAVGMFRKIDIRELLILWVFFLFIHTELYVDTVLKRFSGTTNADGTMTMKGTIVSSLIMMVVVVICAIVF